MAIQIAVRIPEEALAAVDSAIAAGRFESRADAVRKALERLLTGEREREIAEDYRRAYVKHPQDDVIGDAGATLAAESVADLEHVAGDR